jgi:toxin YoeB
MEVYKAKFSAKYESDLHQIKKNNPILLERVGILYNNVLTEPFTGIGNPVPIKGKLKGFWSRRVTDDDRTVFRVKNDKIVKEIICDVDKETNQVFEMVYKVNEKTKTVTFISLLGHSAFVNKFSDCF